MRPAILALSRWQIAAADTQAGQFALVWPGPPVRISWHFRAVSVTEGVLSGRHFALAAQFCEAGGNRGKIIGSAGSAHVSSGRSAGRPQATGLLKGERMLAPIRAIKQAEITERTWEGFSWLTFSRAALRLNSPANANAFLIRDPCDRV